MGIILDRQGDIETIISQPINKTNQEKDKRTYIDDEKIQVKRGRPDLNAKGNKGEQGIQGEKGDQGIQGEKGEKGDQGEKGDRGDQEIQSEKGEKGDQGEKGEKGDQGEKGDRGEQGIQGEKGEQGIQGEKGEQGNKGEKGEQGIQGEKGEQGIQGEKGEQGIQGEKGRDGMNGKDGIDGVQGLQGTTGPKGEDLILSQDLIVASVILGNKSYGIKKSGELSVSKIVIDDIEVNKSDFENLKKFGDFSTKLNDLSGKSSTYATTSSLDEKLLNYVRASDMKQQIKLLQDQLDITNINLQSVKSDLTKTIENITKNQVLMNSNTQSMMNLANTKITDEMSRRFLQLDTRLRRIETKIKI